MTPQRVRGGLILITGVVVLIVGTNTSRWIVDRVNNAFNGRLAQGTIRRASAASRRAFWDCSPSGRALGAQGRRLTGFCVPPPRA